MWGHRVLGHLSWEIIRCKSNGMGQTVKLWPGEGTLCPPSQALPQICGRSGIRFPAISCPKNPPQPRPEGGRSQALTVASFRR